MGDALKTKSSNALRRVRACEIRAPGHRGRSSPARPPSRRWRTPARRRLGPAEVDQHQVPCGRTLCEWAPGRTSIWESSFGLAGSATSTIEVPCGALMCPRNAWVPSRPAPGRRPGSRTSRPRAIRECSPWSRLRIVLPPIPIPGHNPGPPTTTIPQLQPARPPGFRACANRTIHTTASANRTGPGGPRWLAAPGRVGRCRWYSRSSSISATDLAAGPGCPGDTVPDPQATQARAASRKA